MKRISELPFETNDLEKKWLLWGCKLSDASWLAILLRIRG
jgi:hypothetical protein